MIFLVKWGISFSKKLNSLHLALPNNFIVTLRMTSRFTSAVDGRNEEGCALRSAFPCGRIRLRYREESGSEESGNIYISTVWNDLLSVAVGKVLMITRA